MKKILSVLILSVIIFVVNVNAQEIKELSVKQKNYEGTSVQGGCKDVGDAEIIIYSKIQDIKFGGEFNEGQRYISEKNEYILCIDPNRTYTIKISAPDYMPITQQIPKINPGEVIYFIINPQQDKNINSNGEIKKGEFYLNSNPEGAVVTMDGNPDWEKTTPFTFKLYEAKKYSLTLTKANYQPSKIDITINSEKSGSKVLELTPITGYLSIEAGNEASKGAKISIIGNDLGLVPLSKLKYPIGTYTLLIEKNGLSTVKKQITISENQETKLPISLFTAKSITITSNPDRARISIDGKYVGKASLEYDLPIGEHTIVIEKDRHKSQTQSITIGENTPDGKIYNFKIEEDAYSVYISSKPSGASISVDGGYSRQLTNSTINTSFGWHTFKLEADKYFPRTVTYHVGESNNNISKRLFPEKLVNLSFLYGLNSWGLEIGGTLKHFSLALDIFPAIRNNVYKDAPSSDQAGNIFDYDSNFMSETNLKMSFADSTAFGYAIKVGYVILQPFMMRIHVGYGNRSPFNYYPLYKANQNFYNTVYGNVYQGELLQGSELKKDDFDSFTVGIEIPVFNYINLQTDYWFNSECGSGLVFGLGFNLF